MKKCARDISVTYNDSIPSGVVVGDLSRTDASTLEETSDRAPDVAGDISRI